MEGERGAKIHHHQTRKTRKALSDCTNTNITITSSQSSTSSSIIKPSTLKKLLNTTKNPNNVTTTGSTHNYQNDTNRNSSVPLPPASTPPPPQKTASVVTAGNGGDSEVLERSVYTRRQSADKRKGKGKVVVEPLSYSPVAAARILTFRNKINEDGDISLSKSCTVPRKKKSDLSKVKIKEDGGISPSKLCIVPHKKKQRRIPPGQDDSKYSLSQDFVEEQRAYFKEIDEFELPEEEVASGDELE